MKNDKSTNDNRKNKSNASKSNRKTANHNASSKYQVDKSANVRKKRKKRHTGRKIFLTILLILIIVAAYFVYKINKNGGGLQGLITTVVGSSSEKVKNLDDIYVLCMGKSQNMTDTIMVVKYSPKTQQASMLSIPRDSFVGNNKNLATASDKINCKYQISPQSTIDAVNKLTGLKIKYYFTVDTKALRKLVDTIGGVYFDVPIDMNYDDCTQDLAIHIKKGYQLLDGNNAEGVVRFRHNNNGTSYSTEYGDNDLGRMRTQREFIKAVISQTMKPSNITKINELINIATEEVETNIPWDVIKDYIPAVVKFDTNNLVSDMLPGTPQYCNGVSIIIINQTQAQQKVKEMFLTTPNENKDGNSIAEGNTVGSNNSVNVKKNSEIKLEVINGAGGTSKYNAAVTQLQNQGYKVTKKGSSNVTKTTMIIDRKNNALANKEAIKSLLCTGKIEEGKAEGDIDFTIIIGQDY